MVTAQERQRTALTEGLVRRPAYDLPRRDWRWWLGRRIFLSGTGAAAGVGDDVPGGSARL